MREVRACFPAAVIEGEFSLDGGVLSPNELLLSGDWIAIQGSLGSDGVYCLGPGCTVDGARDETFYGAVWLLKPPADFLRLCAEIAAWAAEHPASALRAERFGDYSCEAAVDEHGLPVGWRQVFAAKLAPWRRMFTEEGIRI